MCYTGNTKSPAEFDVTPYLKPGQNLVAVEIYRWSDGLYIEDPDFWCISDIDRNVYVYSAENMALFIPLPALTRMEATKRLTRHGCETQQLQQILENRRSLSGTIGRYQQTVFSQTLRINAAAESKKESSFSRNVSSPNQWSCKLTYLYSLVLTLKDENGKFIETVSTKIGFRKVEIKKFAVDSERQSYLCSRHKYRLPQSGNLTLS